jgi:hypothetical protein
MNIPPRREGAGVIANLLAKLFNKMSEEGRVAICALLSLPQCFHVDAQFSFWLTFVALGGYLSLRLLRFISREGRAIQQRR